MATTTERALIRLMTWLSPSFPVGAFTYSHGLEFAVEDGLVSDGESLRIWVEGALTLGAGRTDGVLCQQAWHAAEAGDMAGVARLNSMATAMRPTAELALESEAQGRAFLTTVRDVADRPALVELADRLKAQGELAAYPVVFGAAAALEGIAARPMLVAFLHAFAANLVSAGVRLVPLGQTAGQRALSALDDAVEGTADRALATPLEDIGSAAPVIDWASMQHETQYSRLFRS